MESRAARRDEDRDRDVLRARCCARTGRSPTSSTRDLHVPQRAAGEALRHRRRQRARVPPRRADRRISAAASSATASVLTVSSYPTRTSPVIRGKYVLQNILGTPPPPPPAGRAGARRTAGWRAEALSRQQLEKHRANRRLRVLPHRKMDPLGFGLENYDAIGKWRTRTASFRWTPAARCRTAVLHHGPAEMRALLQLQLPAVRTVLDREDADLRPAAGASSGTTGGPSTTSIAQAGRRRATVPNADSRNREQPAVPVAPARLKTGCRRRSLRDDDHAQIASTTHVPARNGHGRRAAVSRRDDAGVRRSTDAQSAGADGVRLRARTASTCRNWNPELRRQARRAARRL